MAKPGFWAKRWVISYIIDYAIVILFILGFSAMDLMEPHHQRFSLTNESLQYPFADPERISPFWAAVISCFTPLLVIAVWAMLIDGQFSHHRPATTRNRILAGPWSMSDRLWELNCGVLGLGLSVAGAICVTSALKNATGKPRPDVISRCFPNKDSDAAKKAMENMNNKLWGLVTSKICDQPEHHVLKDGFRSWPSGHSSTAFAGLGYLSLFMAGKMHIMDNRGEVWKTVLVLIPMLGAALVAISRIMDARHHPFDVITGSMLGQFTAWIAYRQYFPAITDPKAKGRAYSHRTWGTDTVTAQQIDYQQAVNYDPRGLEEGGTGSTDSLTGGGASRRRPTLGGPAPIGRSTTFDSVQDEYEMESRSRRPGGPQMTEYNDQRGRDGLRVVPPPAPVHTTGLRSPGGAGPVASPRSPHDNNPFSAQLEAEDYRPSVDMGEHRRGHPPDSPEGHGRLRIGQLSPPLPKMRDPIGPMEELRV